MSSIPHPLLCKQIIDCCEKGDLETLKTIGDTHTSLTFDFTDREGFQPLMTAVHNHHNNIVKFLLTREPSIVCSSNAFGTTSLHVCAYKNNIGGAKALLQSAQEQDCVGDLVNSIDKWGKTPLHHAVYHNHVDIVNLIVDTKKANTLIKDKRGRIANAYTKRFEK